MIRKGRLSLKILKAQRIQYKKRLFNEGGVTKGIGDWYQTSLRRQAKLRASRV
jgi:hypothetical protein